MTRNMEAVGKCEGDKDAAIIVAGDVARDLSVIRKTLLCICEKFAHVFYIPGNHDLWLSNFDKDLGIEHSVQKFHSVLDMCESIGVYTIPMKLCTSTGKCIYIVPLFSWYGKLPQYATETTLVNHSPVEDENRVILDMDADLKDKFP